MLHGDCRVRAFTGIGTIIAGRTLFTIDASNPVAAPDTGYLEMGSTEAGQSPGRSTIAVNSCCLMLEGTPWLPVMGEFHFSRFPQQYWDEEIAKMKAGGIQTVNASRRP